MKAQSSSSFLSRLFPLWQIFDDAYSHYCSSNCSTAPHRSPCSRRTLGWRLIYPGSGIKTQRTLFIIHYIIMPIQLLPITRYFAMCISSTCAVHVLVYEWHQDLTLHYYMYILRFCRTHPLMFLTVLLHWQSEIQIAQILYFSTTNIIVLC